jgi:hypothetical protein
MTLVEWILLLLVLSCTGVLVVGVISFRERENGSQVSLVECVCVDLARCVLPVLDVAPVSPFIAPKERTQATFMVKKVKWGKYEREKQKRWPWV